MLNAILKKISLYNIKILLPVFLVFYFSCSDPSSLINNPNSMKDIDGNRYRTVIIGHQTWMAENLKVTHYRNGDPICHVNEVSEWQNLTKGAWCSYDNLAENVTIFGRLYNWFAVVDERNIAPIGWHVPCDEELKQLEIYLGMSQEEADDWGGRGTDEGGKMKIPGTELWISPNEGATNESGFSGLPSGYCNYTGEFLNKGYIGFYWTISEFSITSAWVHDLHYKYPTIERFHDDKKCGFSVRCLKD